MERFAVDSETLCARKSRPQLLFIANPAQNQIGNVPKLREEKTGSFDARMTSLDGLLRGCEISSHKYVTIRFILRVMHNNLLSKTYENQKVLKVAFQQQKSVKLCTLRAVVGG